MVRELKHTEIGDIPVDWEIQTFEETFKILSNNTLSRENLNNRGGAVRNIHYGDILTQFSEVLKCNEVEIPYINDLSLLSSSTQLLQDGDLIIADTAEDETVGKVTEVQGLGDGKMVAGLHTIPCRVKKGDFVPGWLGYYMNSHMFHDQIIPFITGIKVSSISKSAIAETLIVIPPVDEQKQIVQVLSQIDILIQKEKKVAEKIMAVKRGCLSKMFPKDGECVPEMRLPGFCGAWEQRKLIDISDIVTGTTPPTKDKDNYDGDRLFVSPTDIQGNRYVENTITTLTEKGYALGRELRPGTSLFVSIGSTIGKVAQIKDFATTNQQINAVIPNDDMDDNFTFTMLENEADKIKKLSAQQAVPIINKTTFGDVEIKCPKKDEQTKIGEFFSSIDHLITLHQRKCEKYIGIKSALISMLISAKKQT